MLAQGFRAQRDTQIGRHRFNLRFDKILEAGEGVCMPAG